MSTSTNTLQSQDASRQAPQQPITYEVTPEGYVIAFLQKQEDASTKAELPATSYEITFGPATIATEIASKDESATPEQLRTLKYIQYVVQYVGAVIETVLSVRDTSRPARLPRTTYVLLFAQPQYETKSVQDLGQFIDQGGLVKSAYDFGLGSESAQVSLVQDDRAGLSDSHILFIEGIDEFASADVIAERYIEFRDVNEGIDALYKPSEDSAGLADEVREKDMTIVESILQMDYVGLRRFFLQDEAVGVDAIYKESRDSAGFADIFRPPVIKEEDKGVIEDIESFIVHNEEERGIGIDALYKPDSDEGVFIEREYDVVLEQRSAFRARDNECIELSPEDVSEGIDALYKPSTDASPSSSNEYVLQANADEGTGRDAVAYRMIETSDTGPEIEAIFRGVFDEGKESSTEEVSISSKDAGSFADSIKVRVIKDADAGTFTDSNTFDLGTAKDVYGLIKMPPFMHDIGFRNAVYAVHRELQNLSVKMSYCGTEEGDLITSRCVNTLIEAVAKLSLDMVYLMLGSLHYVAPPDYAPMNMLNELLRFVFKKVRVYRLEG